MKRYFGFLVLCVLLCACGGPQATPVPYPTYTPPSPLPTYTVLPTYTPFPSPVPTDTRVPTEVIPTLEPNPTGSKARPVGLGKAFTFSRGKYQVAMTLLEVLRGTRALETINAGNSLKFTADQGKEYLIARFKVKVESGPEDTITFSSSDFRIEADRQVHGYAITLMDGDLSATLYPGGETQGWVPFYIPAGAAVGGIAYEKTFLGDELVWFAAQ